MNESIKISNIVKIIVVLAAAIAIVAIYILMSTSDKIKEGLNEKIAIGGPFILTDQNNQPFDSTKLKGRISLIYFGFTYCPDVCPTSLQKISDVLKKLESPRKPITSVFITIDPFRDSPEYLKSYISQFGDNMIALSGTDEQIKVVADKFKVYYARSENDSSSSKNSSNYMIDHTSFIYIMDQNFQFLKHFAIDASVEEIVDYLKSIGV